MGDELAAGTGQVFVADAGSGQAALPEPSGSVPVVWLQPRLCFPTGDGGNRSRPWDFQHRSPVCHLQGKPNPVTSTPVHVVNTPGVQVDS